MRSINYRKDIARIESFIAKARLAAWGSKLQPVEGKRKVCCMTDTGFNYYISYLQVKVRADSYREEDPNGKWIEMVVSGDEVYIVRPKNIFYGANPIDTTFLNEQVDSDGHLLPLNTSIAEPAAITRTWFISLIRLLYHRVLQGPKTLNEGSEDQDEKTEDDDAEPEGEGNQVKEKSKRGSQRSKNTKSTSTSSNTSRANNVRRR